MDGARRLKAFRSPPQDHGIARFEAERRCIRSHVGAAFIDDANHAKRGAHAGDMQPCGPVPFCNRGANRIGLFCNRPQATHDIAQSILGQGEAIHHRRCQPFSTSVIQILRIRGQNIRAEFPHIVCRANQGCMFAFSRCCGQGARRSFRARA